MVSAYDIICIICISSAHVCSIIVVVVVAPLFHGTTFSNVYISPFAEEVHLGTGATLDDFE